MFNKFKTQPAFQYKSFRIYLTQRILATCALQMLTVAISQYVYEVTKNPLYLGYVGLALFLPKFCLSPFTGLTADRVDRRLIMLICRFARAVVALLLALLIFSQGSFFLLYLLLVVQGTANAFDGPATQSYVPHLLPREHFPNGATWNSFFFQSGYVLGPILAGWAYSLFGPAKLFLLVSFLSLITFISVLRIPVHTNPDREAKLSLEQFIAGLHYVLHQRVLLGAMSLDLFAVLFGGVVALLPIYANDILHVGPTGFGYLRAAPGFGALMMAIILAQLSKQQQNGRIMMLCVALFGCFTIAFALSTSFWWSLLFLFLLGASDMVSVILRSVMVQLETPDVLRGRVSAINMMFIGASNELGEFESGLTARLFGVVPAAVLGGALTLCVTGLWKKKFPELWHYQEKSSP